MVAPYMLRNSTRICCILYYVHWELRHWCMYLSKQVILEQQWLSTTHTDCDQHMSGVKFPLPTSVVLASLIFGGMAY